MKTSPEKALEKLWPSLLVEFWLSLRDQAETPAMWNAYNRQALLVGKNPAEFEGQELHVGVQGVKMICEKCFKVYPNVHPTAPAWCVCEMPPTRLRKPQEIVAVMEATTKFFMENKLPLR